MSKSTITIEYRSAYLYEQATLKENQQLEEALDKEFTLVKEQQNYYHLAHYGCDHV